MIKQVIDAQTGIIQLVECEDSIYTAIQENIKPPIEEVSLDSIQEDNGMLALMVSTLMAEVDMLKAQIGGI